MLNIVTQAKRAKEACARMALLSGKEKNKLLLAIANNLRKKTPNILRANRKDIKTAESKGTDAGILDRLRLDKKRMDEIIRDVLKVARMKDPVREKIESRTLKNGLKLERVRTPIGVVGVICEARPNVTVDCAVLCLKSGNAVMLKGGSASICSNRAIARAIRKALKTSRVSGVSGAFQFLDSKKHKATETFLSLSEFIDVMIPRGGAGLIKFVKEKAKMPVIETGASVVHAFVDASASIKKGVSVIINSKLRRVSVCNALDTLLLHEKPAEKFLKALAWKLIADKKILEIRADAGAYAILKKIKIGFRKNGLTLRKAVKKDFNTEFLSPVLAVKIVKDLDEALSHISAHSLKHTETIITENRARADRFLKEVDSACVYVNASTQFSDGAQFGLGAEIGISTQKLHARGPFALEGLTSYKWIMRGDYALRPL